MTDANNPTSTSPPLPTSDLSESESEELKTKKELAADVTTDPITLKVEVDEDEYLDEDLEDLKDKESKVKMADALDKLTEEFKKLFEAVNTPVTNETERNALKSETLKFFEKVQSLDDSDKTKSAWQAAVSAIMKQANVSFREATGVEEIRAFRDQAKAAASQDATGVISKLNTRIEKFDGKNPAYPWGSFFASYQIVVQNAKYADGELKAIFLSCLEGEAFRFYQANQRKFLLLSYEELIYRFIQRFDTDAALGVASLMGISQNVGESVDAYFDRLQIKAEAFAPRDVPVRRYMIDPMTNQTTEIDNPDYAVQVMQREAAQKQHDLSLVGYFLRGLRPELINRFQRLDYTDLFDALDEARRIEKLIKSFKEVGHGAVVSNLSFETEEVSANALPALTEMDKRTDPRSKSPKRKDATFSCYKCGKPGHYARDCRSKSKEGRDYPKGKPKSNNQNLVDLMIKALDEREERQRLSRKDAEKKRDRSKSKNRSGSKHRSGSRHRSSSQYGSRSRDSSKKKSKN